MHKVCAPRGLESAIRVFATSQDLARTNADPISLLKVSCRRLVTPAHVSSAHARSSTATQDNLLGVQMVHLAHELLTYKRLWPSDQGSELLVTLAKFWRRQAVSITCTRLAMVAFSTCEKSLLSLRRRGSCDSGGTELYLCTGRTALCSSIWQPCAPHSQASPTWRGPCTRTQGWRMRMLPGSCPLACSPTLPSASGLRWKACPCSGAAPVPPCQMKSWTSWWVMLTILQPSKGLAHPALRPWCILRAQWLLSKLSTSSAAAVLRGPVALPMLQKVGDHIAALHTGDAASLPCSVLSRPCPGAA